MSFTKLVAEIYRDYVLDGVPSSGVHRPDKADIRAWGATAEAMLASADTIASAATANLGSSDSPCITIPGTTTITSFGASAPEGAVKFVTFEGALTLTYNGTSLI